MKKYKLLEKITIKRPIVFLCGPYYDKKSNGDRRKLLKEYLLDHKQPCLPLIIDDFMSEEKINDPTINVQLMEEIFAAVSYRTYIFLDTISAATELGIFANSAYSNYLKVYLPKYDDIFNKSNVGYFVRKGVLREESKLIDAFEYRPQIQRKAIATDYIVEYYGFVNDTIPENIKKDIDDDKELGKVEIIDVQIIKSDSKPKSFNQICYFDNGSALHIKTSLKLLFYATLAIVYSENHDFFSKKDNDFSKIDIGHIIEKVKEAYVNLISANCLIGSYGYDDIKIQTALNSEQNEEVIRHVVKFLHLFNTASDYQSKLLLTKPDGYIIETLGDKEFLPKVISLSSDQVDTIDSIISEPQNYFEKIVINSGKKKREIIKYKNGSEGQSARKLHDFIVKALFKIYMPNDASFAYHKEKGIKDCVIKHLESNSFIKYDIKKFFNSITLNSATNALMTEFNLEDKNKVLLKRILSTCFYENSMPLGLVTSPIISDILMKHFDEKMGKLAVENGLVYTRYADDMLFSAKDGISDGLHDLVDSVMKEELGKIGLRLNKDKTLFLTFDDMHSFIKYIGITIVHVTSGNYLSVGKDYIYDTAKDYIEYQKKYADVKDDSEEKFYAQKRVIGKVGYIRHIEGEKGIQRLKRRLSKHIDFQANSDLKIVI